MEELTNLIMKQREYTESLLQVEFVYVQEYLAAIEFISKLLAEHQINSISYLCSAVSDFYIPLDKVPEHKI